MQRKPTRTSTSTRSGSSLASDNSTGTEIRRFNVRTCSSDPSKITDRSYVYGRNLATLTIVTIPVIYHLNKAKMFKSVVSLALIASAAAFAPASSFNRPATSLFGETEDKVKDIIVEQLGVDADKVVPGASFIDDLGADSLDTVELIMAIEEEFDTEIPEEEAASIATVQDAIDFVAKL